MANATILGSVQDIRGASLGVVLDPATVSGLTFIEGKGYRIGQIGSFVRVSIGYLDLFGIVSEVGAGAVPQSQVEIEPYGHRWMKVQLIGEAPRNGAFERGITQYPTIGDPVHLVTESDLRRIYGYSNDKGLIDIGRVASAEAIPALLDANKLVMRHSAVLGSTGSGKSTTVAKLLNALSEPAAYPSARILVLDLHGEYGQALRSRATIFRSSGGGELAPAADSQPLVVPYWAMTLDELLPLTFGSVDDNARGVIAERIVALKREALEHGEFGVTEDLVTVDTPIPFSIHRLWFELHRLVWATHTAPGSGQSEATEALLENSDGSPEQPGDAMRVIPPRYQAQRDRTIYLSGSNLNIRRQLDALAARLRDSRYDFLFRPGSWCPDLEGRVKSDLGELLCCWIGSERPVSILDLSGVPTSIVKDLVGALLRVTYDALMWGRFQVEGGRQRPLLVVLEEAHSYVPPGDAGAAATIVRRIVKEGRKYGVGAMIVSQRPTELDSTVLSQCGTIVALRLTNGNDRAQVAQVVSDELAGMLGVLPILRTGEAIVLGEGVHLPTRAVVDPPAEEHRPDSKDPLVYVRPDVASGGWNSARASGNDAAYKALVDCWRHQRVAVDESK